MYYTCLYVHNMLHRAFVYEAFRAGAISICRPFIGLHLSPTLNSSDHGENLGDDDALHFDELTDLSGVKAVIVFRVHESTHCLQRSALYLHCFYSISALYLNNLYSIFATFPQPIGLCTMSIYNVSLQCLYIASKVSLRCRYNSQGLHSHS